MTEVHVHGVIAAGDRVPPGARTLAHGDVVALVTDAAEHSRAAGLVRAHWRLLDEAAREATVLPVRFGTAMAGDDAVVQEFLEPEHDRLAARLAALRGKVQMTVKGAYDERALLTAVLASSPEIARMQQRVKALPEEAGYYERIELGQRISREVEQLRERDAELVHQRLAPLAIASRRERPATLDGAVNAAFLIERSGLETFAGDADRLARELRGRIGLRCVGPLPPYSFTEEEAWV
jgi:hypothetical protein